MEQASVFLPVCLSQKSLPAAVAPVAVDPATVVPVAVAPSAVALPPDFVDFQPPSAYFVKLSSAACSL